MVSFLSYYRLLEVTVGYRRLLKVTERLLKVTVVYYRLRKVT